MIRFLLIGITWVSIGFCSQAFSAPINALHLSCTSDSECTILTVGCACLHNSTCSASTDIDQGIVAVVNKDYLKNYTDLSECSPEMRECANAAPCPLKGQWQAKCMNNLCSAVFTYKD